MIVPWFPHKATEFLLDILKPNMRVFEWGSGESTVFSAKRVTEIISVEHNKKCFFDLGELLIQHGITNCIPLYILPEGGEIGHDNSCPAAYFSGGFPGFNFRKYASAINQYKEPFDLIVIDGRARPSCILHGYKRVTPGGFLLLDNSDRDYYHPTMELVKNWEKHIFFDHGPYLRDPWECTIWRNPG